MSGSGQLEFIAQTECAMITHHGAPERIGSSSRRAGSNIFLPRARAAAVALLLLSLFVSALVMLSQKQPILESFPGILESNEVFEQPQHAQQPRGPGNGLVFSNKPVEPFQNSQIKANRVGALPWYTSASQQDEKWGGVHQSANGVNAVQNAYLYAQHVAQSRTGQLLRWRNYVTQHRSDATPKEQIAQAQGMAYVASTEYNQARAQLAAMKKMAVIRRLDAKRQEAKEVTSDVNRFATSMLRNQDLAQVKQDEAYGKIAAASKILNRMAHSGLLRRKSANQRLRHLQQLPYAVTQVVPNSQASSPNVRGYVSNGYQNLPAYGGPAVTDCGPAGSSMASDTVCNGVPTTVAAKMLGTRLQVGRARCVHLGSCSLQVVVVLAAWQARHAGALRCYRVLYIHRKYTVYLL